MSGVQDIVIAAGVESMTRVPMGLPVILPMQAGIGTGPWPQSIKDRFGVTEFSQFTGAEMIARDYGFSRDDLDAFALDSHRKAAAARDAGAFDREIVVLDVTDKDGNPQRHAADEGIRADASMEGLGALKTIAADGVITAGNASQICDGASGVLIVSERALKAHNLTPLARIDTMTVTAGDPVIMLMEPIPATMPRARAVGPRPSPTSTSPKSTRRSRRCRWPGCAIPAPTPPGSTSMAARSRSAIRLARVAPS